MLMPASWGVQGSGRDKNTFGPHRLNFVDAHFVVAADLYLCAQFTKILDQVVSKTNRSYRGRRPRIHCSLTCWPLLAMLTGDLQQAGIEALKLGFLRRFNGRDTAEH